ncbi:hypothetical protein CR513_09013, partial [Mucuna pruriens]
MMIGNSDIPFQSSRYTNTTIVSKFLNSFVSVTREIRSISTASRDSICLFLTLILAIPDISLQASTMGIFRSCFSFIAGAVFGVYLAQSYQVPNVKKEADTALLQAKQVEEKYRKSK